MSDSQLYLAQREADARFSSEPSPNREECFLCKRMIQQCPDFDRWFVEDESGWVPTHYSDFTDAYQIQEGWVCGTACYADHTVEPEYEEPQLQLIQGGRA